MLFKRRKRLGWGPRLSSWLWPRGGWRRAFAYGWRRIIRLSASPHAIALGFAAGIFASFTPFMGFHFLLGAVVALVLGGNIVASAFGTFFGNPITFPFIWIATYNFGGLVLGHDMRDEVVLKFPDGTFFNLLHHPSYGWEQFWKVLAPVVTPMTVGGVVLGSIVATASYVLIRAAVAAYQNRRRTRLSARKQRSGKVVESSETQ